MNHGKIEWWGYLHTNGAILPKRYFGPRDISEANESPFVAEVYGPFNAHGVEDARIILNKHFRPFKGDTPCITE